MILNAILLMLPVLQLGISYWVGTATIAAIFVCGSLKVDFVVRQISLRGENVISLIFVSLCYLLSNIDLNSADPVGDTLATARVLMFWLMMTSFITANNSTDILSRQPTKVFPHLLVFTSAGMLMLVVVQWFRLQSGYVGIPQDWFIQNANTLPGELDIKYSYIRPFGTFGEPSYLAFYCLSLMLISLGMCRYKQTARHGKIALFLLTATGLLSQSFAFEMGLGVILITIVTERSSQWFRSRARAVFYAGAVATLLLLVIWIIIQASAGISERLAAITSGSDDSVNFRIFAPFQVMIAYLGLHPLGLPRTRMAEELNRLAIPLLQNSEFQADNAIFSTIYQFGIAGAVLLYRYIACSVDIWVAAYLLLTLNFNGAIFSVDKFTVIVFSVALYLHYSRTNEKSTPNIEIRKRRQKIEIVAPD
jgi:hypothetical protein